MEMVMDKIQRWKILGKILFDQNKKTFIKKINEDLHFCNIILLSEDYILIKNFGPGQRKDLEEKIYWAQIIDFDEFKEDNLKNGNKIGIKNDKT